MEFIIVYIIHYSDRILLKKKSKHQINIIFTAKWHKPNYKYKMFSDYFAKMYDIEIMPMPMLMHMHMLEIHSVI